LCNTAEKILAWRPDVFVARLGGDEFGILITGEVLDARFSEELEKLHQSICGPFVSKPGEVSVGVSIGAAVFPSDATNCPEWLHSADKAMQRAKHENGGVRCFDPSIDL